MYSHNTPHLLVHPACNVLDFWVSAHHIVISTGLSKALHSRLDSLQRFGQSCVKIFKVHAAIADRVLDEAEALAMSKHLSKCVKQVSRIIKETLPSKPTHSLESFLKLLASCYVLTKVSDSFLFTSSEIRGQENQVFRDKQHSSFRYESVPSLESILTNLSQSAPQAIHRAYQECLDREKLSENSESLESFENGFILKVFLYAT